jgi:hypothetical protein
MNEIMIASLLLLRDIALQLLRESEDDQSKVISLIDELIEKRKQK